MIDKEVNQFLNKILTYNNEKQIYLKDEEVIKE